MCWQKQVDCLNQSLNNLLVTDANGKPLQHRDAFWRLKETTEAIRQRGNCIYLVGNGASASMASHFSADLAKNGSVKTQVLTDMSLITAISNDIAYDMVFAEPIKWWLSLDEMFVGISSSGNSPNVINAAKQTREKGGYVITLTSMKPSNNLRQLGDINFYVPGDTYGLAETSHNVILHYWVDLMVGDANL